jgi:hypothetical protein
MLSSLILVLLEARIGKGAALVTAKPNLSDLTANFSDGFCQLCAIEAMRKEVEFNTD